MKKIRQERPRSTKQLALLRETLRRLDAQDLQNIPGMGTNASVIRPTTDP